MNDVSTNRVVNVDPNEIFAQFGLGTPSTSQTVQQRAMSIQVENPVHDVEDAEFEEVSPDLLPPPEVQDIIDEVHSSLESQDVVEEIDNGPFNESLNELNEAIDNHLEQEAQSEIPLTPQESLSPEEIIQNYIIGVDTVDPNSSDQSAEIVEHEESPSEEPEDNIHSLLDRIPLNPRSLEVDDTTSRFSGASWFNAVQQSTVLLAGLGGIGSYILFLLSRMKPRQVFIYDDDEVEIGNLSGQLYSKSMIGLKKVNAASQMAADFSNYHSVMACSQRFTIDTPATDIMICGFDNMEARSLFFHSWLKHVASSDNKENCLFIDGRLAAEELQVFCMTGTDRFYMQRYMEEYLFSDYDADATMCSYKQTSYCANMIGSIIVNLYTNFIANTLNPVIKRDLPFKTYYDASLMFFKTEV